VDEAACGCVWALGRVCRSGRGREVSRKRSFERDGGDCIGGRGDRGRDGDDRRSRFR
jgi:hypothetical protein